MVVGKLSKYRVHYSLGTDLLVLSKTSLQDILYGKGRLAQYPHSDSMGDFRYGGRFSSNPNFLVVRQVPTYTIFQQCFYFQAWHIRRSSSVSALLRLVYKHICWQVGRYHLITGSITQINLQTLKIMLFLVLV